MASEKIHIGLVYPGKEIEVDVSFDIDQDVNDAFVKFTVPAGVTYSSDALPRGVYNEITNTWIIGQVSANEAELNGTVAFSITDGSISEFEFTLEGGVESACQGCLNGNSRTIKYTGITCEELTECITTPEPTPTVVIGQIVLFGGASIPSGWVSCDGSLLDVATYPDLFTVVGTTYGGDGVTTFGVPDLRGRVPVGTGTGVGLTARSLADTGGEEDSTLTTNELPAHTHTASAATNSGLASNEPNSTDNYLPITTGGNFYSNTKSPVADFASDMVEVTVDSEGSGNSFTNMQPFIAINYIIATEGVAP